VNRDLRLTNDRADRKRKRLADYRQRTAQRRNKRRQVDLIGLLVQSGAVRK